MDPERSVSSIPPNSRALKIENAVNATELKRKTRELAEAKNELRCLPPACFPLFVYLVCALSVFVIPEYAIHGFVVNNMSLTEQLEGCGDRGSEETNGHEGPSASIH